MRLVRKSHSQCSLTGVLLACVSGAILALIAPVSEAQSGDLSGAIVRPCSNEEWQLAFSPEAKKLTEKELEDMGGFNSCEAAIVPFLPNAHILRLHTPIHVDYSYTATLLQAKSDGPLRLVSSLRGMVGPPHPENAESIAALNFLLSGANLTFDVATVRTVSDLYFFILDSSEKFSLLRPIAKVPVRLDEDSFETIVRMSPLSAKVTYRGNPWQLTFESRGGTIELTSVKSSDH